MKNQFILLGSAFFLLLLLAGCQTIPSGKEAEEEVVKDDVPNEEVCCTELGEPSIELAYKSVGIHVAENSAVYLRYNFIIKNKGTQTVGGIEETKPETFEIEEGLTYTIEPSEELLKIVIELFGFNIFDESERVVNNFGMGESITPMLKAGELGNNYLDFELDVKEKTDQNMVNISTELINTLKENALNSTLIVSVKDKEIARLKLNE